MIQYRLVLYQSTTAEAPKGSFVLSMVTLPATSTASAIQVFDSGSFQASAQYVGRWRTYDFASAIDLH